MRADLVRMGLRLTDLGTAAMTWGDFAAWLKYADHTTAVYHAKNGHNWNIDTVLLANLFDVNMAALYQFNKVNRGRMRKPAPFPRPESLRGDNNDSKDLGTAHDLDDIKRFLERKNGR